MTLVSRTLIGTAFTAVLIGLVAVDTILREPLPARPSLPTFNWPWAGDPEPAPPSEPSEPTGPGLIAEGTPTSSAPSTPTTEPDVPLVPRSTGPDIPAILAEAGFTFQETGEPTFLEQLVDPEKHTVQQYVLLLNGDRAGILAWIHTPEVKPYFATLKEVLHAAFSAEVQDLVDEVQKPSDGPTRNILTFIDPAISQERVAFVRVRESLLEMRMAPQAEPQMYDLLDRLSQ